MVCCCGLLCALLLPRNALVFVAWARRVLWALVPATLQDLDPLGGLAL
jgi:hypothetical protein